LNEHEIRHIDIVVLVVGVAVIVGIFYLGIPILHSLFFGGEEIIPDHECEEGYFLAFSNTDNQWLCGKCKTITFGNQEYDCELQYKPATKIP